MAAVHQLSRADARRIAIRAQLLTAERPTGLLETIYGLSVLQLEPTKAIAPSADLVLWSRLGHSYDPQQLRDAVDEQRLIELRGLVRPPEDIALFRAEMAAWPGVGELKDWQRSNRAWVHANDACRLDVLDRLRADGPLPSDELPDTCVVPWRSSGWNNNRNLPMLLGLMVQRGEIAAAGGEGRDRLWDLAERVYPDDPIIALDEALARRDERRLGALGIARPRGPVQTIDPLELGEAGEPAVVEGVRGKWRVDPAQLGRPFEGRAALLSPFDRLIQDRKRMSDLFEFDYNLEMFKPAAQRIWGYYALPVLYDDRLVGKLDATVDGAAGAFTVNALHEDEAFTPEMAIAVEREIDDLVVWLGLTRDLS